MLDFTIECQETPLNFDSVESSQEIGEFHGVEKGDPGFSPSAKVERIDNGAKITITDKDGTTEATIHDGTSGAYSWNNISGKPFESIGSNLKVVNGALTVDTAQGVEEDNTRPITSAAVYVEVGNINALLALI